MLSTYLGPDVEGRSTFVKSNGAVLSTTRTARTRSARAASLRSATVCSHADTLDLESGTWSPKAAAGGRAGNWS